MIHSQDRHFPRQYPHLVAQPQATADQRYVDPAVQPRGTGIELELRDLGLDAKERQITIFFQRSRQDHRRLVNDVAVHRIGLRTVFFGLTNVIEAAGCEQARQRLVASQPRRIGHPDRAHPPEGHPPEPNLPDIQTPIRPQLDRKARGILDPDHSLAASGPVLNPHLTDAGDAAQLFGVADRQIQAEKIAHVGARCCRPYQRSVSAGASSLCSRSPRPA